ncbi:MAG: hypothetical protein ACLTXI_01335 [Collinsella sp.]
MERAHSAGLAEAGRTRVSVPCVYGGTCGEAFATTPAARVLDAAGVVCRASARSCI